MLEKFLEPLAESECADWRANFSSIEVKKLQEYFVYFKIFERREKENLPSRCVRGFSQRFLGQIFVCHSTEMERLVGMTHT